MLTHAERGTWGPQLQRNGWCERYISTTWYSFCLTLSVVSYLLMIDKFQSLSTKKFGKNVMVQPAVLCWSWKTSCQVVNLLSTQLFRISVLPIRNSCRPFPWGIIAHIFRTIVIFGRVHCTSHHPTSCCCCCSPASKRVHRIFILFSNGHVSYSLPSSTIYHLNQVFALMPISNWNSPRPWIHCGKEHEGHFFCQLMPAINSYVSNLMMTMKSLFKSKDSLFCQFLTWCLQILILQWMHPWQ